MRSKLSLVWKFKRSIILHLLVKLNFLYLLNVLDIEKRDNERGEEERGRRREGGIDIS